jgi:hypothetical protein
MVDVGVRRGGGDLKPAWDFSKRFVGTRLILFATAELLLLIDFGETCVGVLLLPCTEAILRESFW